MRCLRQLLNALFDNDRRLLPQVGIAVGQQRNLHALFDQIDAGKMRIEMDYRAGVINDVRQFDGLRIRRGFGGVAEVGDFARGAVFGVRRWESVSISTSSATSGPKKLLMSFKVEGVSSTVSCSHAAASITSLSVTLLTSSTTAAG